MGKNYLCILLLFFGLLACKEKDLLNGIFITGDHTTILRFWRGENNGIMRLANFRDSTNIAYPTYWLNISDKYAEFYYQADANTAKIGYFALTPAIKQNSREILELENLKLVFAKDIVAGTELIGIDETKSIILNGSIEKK